MKRKIKSAKGFTLAELLIVVAIIAVLVAIGIPIFTSQLEKSREAVDLSDVRSAYAEVMMAAITGDTTAIYTKDAGQTIYKATEQTSKGYTIEAGAYSITVTPLKQKQSGWQTAEPITIGGVSSKAGEPYWKGQPGPNGFCVITYHPPTSGRDEYVSFYWEGGSASDDPTVTPIPDNPLNPTVTPTDPSKPSSGNWSDIMAKAKEYPKSGKVTLIPGDVYREGESYYVIKCFKNDDVKWVGPSVAKNEYVFQKCSGTVYTSADEYDKENHKIGNIKAGDIYKDDHGTLYIATENMSHQNTPMSSYYDHKNWQQIN